MQSHEPPGADDRAARADSGHARHRRRRTDPPTPADGMPFIRQEPSPRTVGEYVSRRNGPASGSGRYRAVTATPPSGSRPADGSPPATAPPAAAPAEGGGQGTDTQHGGGAQPAPGTDAPARAPGGGAHDPTDHRVDPEYRERRRARTRTPEHPDPDPFSIANPAPVEDPPRRTPVGRRPRTVSDAARGHGPGSRTSAAPVRHPATGPQARVPAAGHGHGHGPAAPAGRRVRILLAALLVPCALATVIGVFLLRPGPPPTPSVPPQQTVQATVTATQAADCTPGSGSGGCTGVTVAMSDGPRAGRDLVQLVPAEPSTPRFAVGDEVVLAYSGGDADDPGSYQITDFQRGGSLLWLAGAFALAVLALGRWRGLASLVALGLSFVILALFVLPSILGGNNPLAVAVTGACLIMFVVLYLSHGFSARTSCAVLGTLVSLALIGVLGALFSAATRLTGLDDTTANLIGTLGGVPIDARGLVLAGLVIGALGVLDDVTVTQASAVWELRDADPSMGPRALFAAGMRIGRDHVSSAVNTLVLAYAGAALPLMLLFTVSSAGIGQILTSQDVATEIVRTLVGSIGLVASVPLTTGLAALVAARNGPSSTAPAYTTW